MKPMRRDLSKLDRKVDKPGQDVTSFKSDMGDVNEGLSDVRGNVEGSKNRR